nr:MAG TPA: hypothetical protein [Caudoviricetes sp.]
MQSRGGAFVNKNYNKKITPIDRYRLSQGRSARFPKKI